MTSKSTLYKRVLIKLSGEALMGEMNYGIDPAMIERVAKEVAEVVAMGVEVGIVIGGGNIFRGAGLAESGMNRVTGDSMGMLATVMNSLAMNDALDKIGQPAVVMAGLAIPRVWEEFTQRDTIAQLENAKVVICAEGTGNP